MCNDDYQEEVLDSLALLRGQVHELQTTYLRMMATMIAEHHLRLELLDKLIAEQKQRDAKLDKLIRDCSTNDDWWKGEEPPWT